LKRFLFLVGARPQIIKFAALFSEIKRHRLKYILVHSGQHYDKTLSDIFFEELNLPEPHYNLKVGSGSHASQTAEIMLALQNVIDREKPDFGVLFGDTNTTLAGSLLFSQKNIPFAHIEAGLRSYNKNMPEEINRIITDRLALILFTPSRLASENLKKEGIIENVYEVGDLHFDLFKKVEHRINNNPAPKKPYVFLTVHREENTESPEFIQSLLNALDREKIRCIFPAHPRTHNLVKNLKLKHIEIIKPLPYLKTLNFIKHADMVITDSGGLQKEAYFLKKRVIILRKETEWGEIVKSGFAKLAGRDIETVIKLLKTPWEVGKYFNYYGTGNAAHKIAELLVSL